MDVLKQKSGFSIENILRSEDMPEESHIQSRKPPEAHAFFNNNNNNKSLNDCDLTGSSKFDALCENNFYQQIMNFQKTAASYMPHFTGTPAPIPYFDHYNHITECEGGWFLFFNFCWEIAS